MRLNRYALMVVLATFGLSLKGIWARLAYAEGLDVSGVLFYRSALATPLFLALGALLLRRSQSTLRGQVRVPARSWLLAALLGGAFSIGMYSDFQAIAFLGAGVSRVILFGFPVVVLAIEAIGRRQAPQASRLAGFSVAWLGLALVASGHAGGASPAWETGLGWSLLSMVLYGLFVSVSVPLSRKLGSVRLTVVSNFTTGVTVLAVLLVQSGGDAPPASPAALGWVSVMVVVSTVMPYFMLTEGIRRLGGSEASILAMLGPPLTLSAGFLVLDEDLSITQLLGTAAVLAGVFFSRKSAPQVPPSRGAPKASARRISTPVASRRFRPTSLTPRSRIRSN